MSLNLETALKKANEIEDKKVYAALQLAKGDRRLETLLEPLADPLKQGADVPSDEGNRRNAMCPDLYRATLSGSAYYVNELLGLTMDISLINGVDVTDVKVLLEDPPENKRSKKHWGGRIHGDGLCSLQEVSAEKNTVLHIAAEQGHADLLEQIIRRDNTLLVYENSRLEVPLHSAARAGHCHAVSIILLLAQESGIGAYEVLRKRNIEGDTVLHEAARHGHEDVVKVLMIVAPALSAEVNNASMSPLYLAVVRESIGVVKALLEYTHTSAGGPNEQNALHAAVLGSHEIALMLLNWKAELVKERDATGSTPMHYAASSRDVIAVKNILEETPWAVYIQDQEGLSPLHVAARMGNYSAINCIMDYCPDLFELRDNHGQNFLHIVAKHGGGEMKLNHHDFKKLTSIINLISKSPDLKRLVNERDNDGNTPLHVASMNGFSEFILQLLKKTEADTTLMNNEGKTALDQAASLSSFFVMAGTIVALSAYGAIFGPCRQDKLMNSNDKTTKWINRVSKNLIVVSVLIATIAFSAAFNVSGSYNNEGVANLRQKKQYNIFLVLDTIAMSTSTSAAMLLVVAKAVSKRGSWISFSLSIIFLWISLFAMELAFAIAVSLSLGKGRTVTKSIIYSTSIYFFSCTVSTIHKIGSPVKLRTRSKFLSAIKEKTQTTRQINIQFPKLASYIRRSNLFIFLNLFLYITTLAIVWIAPWFDY